MSSKVIVRSIPLPNGKNVGYIEPRTHELVHARRASVVTSTPFIKELIADGKLNLLAHKLPIEATDEEFFEFLESSGDEELAVASYTALFGDTIETPKQVTPAAPVRRRGGRPKKKTT